MNYENLKNMQKIQEYVTNMRPAFNKRAVFSDETEVQNTGGEHTHLPLPYGKRTWSGHSGKRDWSRCEKHAGGKMLLFTHRPWTPHQDKTGQGQRFGAGRNHIPGH